MIERIEIKGFESHENTVLDDFSPGLNLLCGESMAGKTSIIRALKLVAYNEFEPKSLRVGHTHCDIKITTHRGTVRVRRGPKHNNWEVTPKGKPTQYFDKVGKEPVPAAAEIIGLNVVTLGDVEVPVNIMDQLESHFLLKGIGGKDASGSMRAQIIDEISGLSGIEGIVKDVGLDIYRSGREVKESEDGIKVLQNQMHPEAALKAEAVTLGEAVEFVKAADEYSDAVMVGTETIGVGEILSRDRDLAEKGLKAIPDIEAAGKLLTKADAALSRVVRAKETLLGHRRANESHIAAKERFSAIPEVPAGLFDAPKKALEGRKRAQELVEVAEAASVRLVALRGELRGMEGDFQGSVKDAGLLVDKVGKAAELMEAVRRVQGDIARMDGAVKKAEMGLAAAERDRDAVLAEVKTCPLTRKPIRKECLEEAK